MARGLYDNEESNDGYYDDSGPIKKSRSERKADKRAARTTSSDDAPANASPISGERDGKEKKSKSDEGVDDFLGGVEDLTDDEKTGLEDRGFLVKESSNRKKAGFVKRYAKKKVAVAAGGAAVGLAGGALGVFLSFLPFELDFVKNVFQTNIGGTSGTVLQTRTGRLYSRTFFFHKEPGGDSVFDGKKERGMVAALTGKNIRSNSLLSRMRNDGFEVKVAKNSLGQFTGGLESISFPRKGSVGPGQPVSVNITKGGAFRSEWASRGAAKKEIRKFFNSEFNSGSRFWRGIEARKVYRRYGLNRLRGDIFAAAAARKIDSLRLTLRDRLYPLDEPSGVNVDSVTTETGPNADGSPASDVETQRGGVYGDRASAKRAALHEPGPRGRGLIYRALSPKEVVKNFKPSTSAKAALRTVQLFGAVDTVCQLKRILNTVVVASRVLRSEALMEYASLFFSVADNSILGGVASSKLGEFTGMLRRQNPETGRDFFGSGSFAYASSGTGIINGDIKAAYSVGGGLSGTLGEWNRKIGKAVGTTTCDIVTNIYFQGIVGIASIAVAVWATPFSITRVAVGAGVGLGSGLALGIVEAIAIPMIIDMVAGTVIHGDEYGDEVAAALLSGYGTLTAVQASNHGMRPVSNAQAAILTQERDRLIAQDQAEMSVFERYFSTSNIRSLTNTAAISMPRNLKSAMTSFSSLFSNPFSVFTGPAAVITGNNAFVSAQGFSDTSICQDGDIVNNNIAADPFCNPIYGEDIQTLSIDPVVNLNFMLRAVCADTTECPFVDEDGVPQDNPNGRLYTEYLDKCVNNIDVLHDNTNEFGTQFTSECYSDNRVAHADGTIEIISDQQVALREATTYNFDDLEIAYMIQDGDYEESSHAGKAYAQAGENLAVRSTIPTLLERFRVQRMDQVILASIEEDFNGVFTEREAVAQQQTTPGGSLIIGDPNTESASVACVAPTVDLGIHDTFLGGVKTDGRLCRLPNLRSNGDASQSSNTDFYVDGSNGFAMVNSRMSGAWYQIIEDLNAHLATEGEPAIVADSSFRPMKQQEQLCANNTACNTAVTQGCSSSAGCANGGNYFGVAKPGHSSHQAGTAIDFNTNWGPGVVSSATCSSGRATDASIAFIWLRENAPRYGVFQYAKEAWHWDALPNDLRCDKEKANTTPPGSGCPAGVSAEALYQENCSALSTIIGNNQAAFDSLKQLKIDAGGLIDSAQTSSIGTTRIATSIKADYDNMVAAASANSVTLEPVSAFRSFEDQALQRIEFCGMNGQTVSFQHIFNGQNNLTVCTVHVARPGSSNHNTGRAIDFGINGVTDQASYADTPAFTWLDANASTFGFSTISGEPWHWESE